MPQIEGDYLELSVVGDFDPEALKTALTTTFAALPVRKATEQKYPDALDIQFPATEQEKVFTYESKIPKAAAMVLWKTQGMGDEISKARRFNIVAECPEQSHARKNPRGTRSDLLSTSGLRAFGQLP